MQRTISVMMGKGSVNHNTRSFNAENTDPERTQYNRSYCNVPIKDIYRELFDEAVKRYNEKQNRSDRQIPDYYKKICTGKQEKPFHEIILQIGNHEDMNAKTEKGELAAEILEKYMSKFQERNPNLKVFSAHLHMDEATPHLHIDFVPFTTGSKRGLDTRVSLKQALAVQGFNGGSRSETEWNQWVRSEKEQLSIVMQQHGIEWEQLGTHNQHLSVLDYKKHERTKEVTELEEKSVFISQTIEEKQNTTIALESKISEEEKALKEIKGKKVSIKKVDGIIAKSTIFDSSKVVVDKIEFDGIKTLAKKQIAVESKEKALSSKNVELVAENKVLKSENTNLKSELYEYKSIKNKLSVNKLEAKVDQLQRFIDRIMDFAEKMGLKPQLDKFLKKNISIEK